MKFNGRAWLAAELTVLMVLIPLSAWVSGLLPVHAQVTLPPTIATSFASNTGLVYHLDLWTGVEGHPRALTQTPAPNTPVQVYVNGLLMAAGIDYAISGNLLTFTGQTLDEYDAPSVQIWYWAAN